MRTKKLYIARGFLESRWSRRDYLHDL